ncbi:MAG: hypothetical protein E6K73_01525 [Candidatus Eisenbacteria bacterium]|uniref:T9SS type A sorting domain-containing protein n=1 Tax=Eiseniibacteriota bacterium TaxID=2212470 RepID=A0A538SPN0_UNCEI|nr:MAG: hypothetical protein E6K73_01525 [Candidatus Eisenbacteria bacterium]
MPPTRRFAAASIRFRFALLVVSLGLIRPLLALGQTDGAWVALDPPARQSFSLVRDAARDRLVLFGGFQGGHGDFNDVWSLALGGSARWRVERPAGTPPAAREGQATAYDSRRGRMLVLGGSSNGGDLGDVWSLDLTGTMSWQQVIPSGTAPAAREFSSAVYDSLRDRLLLFGGVLSDGTGLDDLWALSLTGTPTWTPLSPSGAPPAPRAGAALVLDPVRDRLILFGGGQPILGSDQQTWALSLGDSMKWEQVTTSGTPPDGLYGRAGIYDPIGDRFVTISGVSHSTPVALALADTVPAWTWLAPSGPPDEPPGRYINGMAYDPVRRALVICGGYVNNSLDDTWSFCFDLSMWTRLAPIGEDLPARTDHAATIDPMSGRVIVFGGRDPFDRGDVWAMDLEGTAGWDSIVAEGTPPDVASDVAAACDTRRHRMLYFGGESTAHGISNAVWALDLDGTPTWSELITSGTPPSPRTGSAAIYDPVSDRLVVFGGLVTAPTSGVSDEVWCLTLSGTPTWSRWTPGAGPSGRAYASASYDAARHRMLVFGGFYYGDPGVDNDVWGLSLGDTATWTGVTPAGAAPAGRYGATAVVDRARDRLLVAGGGYPDVWALDLSGGSPWIELHPAAPAPEARQGSEAVYDVVGDRMIVIGGQNSTYTYESDSWALSFGGVTRPSVGCPEPQIWMPGSNLVIGFTVTNRLGSAADYRWSAAYDRGWPVLTPGVIRLGPAATDSVHLSIPVPDTAAMGVVRVTLTTWLDAEPRLVDRCEFHIRDALTPTRLDLAWAPEFTARGIRLTWFSAEPVGQAELFRREGISEWMDLSPLWQDGTGRLAFEDTTVVAGHTYAYRLRYQNGDAEAWTHEVMVRAPAPGLFVFGTRPSPARGDWSVMFDLPEGGAAAIRLLDAAGREIRELRVSGSPGLNQVPMGHLGLRPGVYWLRVRQGGPAASRRIVVIQ